MPGSAARDRTREPEGKRVDRVMSGARPGLLGVSFLALAVLACRALAFVAPATGNGSQPPDSAPLFQDDFSDPSSGWDRTHDEEGLTDYEAGVYHIRIDKPNWYFWSTPNLHFTDVRVEVEASVVGGPDINEFGLICRNQDALNFYFFTISSDGYYAVSKFVDGEEELIDMDSFQYHEAINQGIADNHLRLDCVGSRLTAYVNGRILAEVQDSQFPSGDVGLIVGTFDEPGVAVQFDNFTVLRP